MSLQKIATGICKVKYCRESKQNKDRLKGAIFIISWTPSNTNLSVLSSNGRNVSCKPVNVTRDSHILRFCWYNAMIEHSTCRLFAELSWHSDVRGHILECSAPRPCVKLKNLFLRNLVYYSRELRLLEMKHTGAVFHRLNNIVHFMLLFHYTNHSAVKHQNCEQPACHASQALLHQFLERLVLNPCQPPGPLAPHVRHQHFYQ